MRRVVTNERPDWQERAREFGFKFHTMYGEAYWDESAYYEFSLRQIEDHIEDPTEELHQMCLDVVDKVVNDEELFAKFQIPEQHWDFIRRSWLNKEPSLYSRLDLAYDGKSPAKLYENNADTPTSLYESGFWQWLWLEDKIVSGVLHPNSDQFNSIQEKLIERFRSMGEIYPEKLLHFSCCRDTEEDRGTVQYLEDCAQEAGLFTEFVYIEDVGLGEVELGDNSGRCIPAYTDTNDQVIDWMFKLYPWEFMLREDFGGHFSKAQTSWIEPPWKALLSNKALMPLLWQLFPNHPNLLPCFFDEKQAAQHLNSYVKKPIFAREGANVSVFENGEMTYHSDGPYGEEGFIFQAFYPLPCFNNNYTLIGSWLIDNQPAGISVREDSTLITQDLSRYLPHIICP